MKFWGQDTLDKADEEYQQWLASGTDPNQTPLGLSSKLAKIRAIEGDNVKLVIANFVAPHSDCQLLGFSSQLIPTSGSLSCRYPHPRRVYYFPTHDFISYVLGFKSYYL